MVHAHDERERKGRAVGASITSNCRKTLLFRLTAYKPQRKDTLWEKQPQKKDARGSAYFSFIHTHYTYLISDVGMRDQRDQCSDVWNTHVGCLQFVESKIYEKQRYLFQKVRKFASKFSLTPGKNEQKLNAEIRKFRRFELIL